jgi:hypothetical protein
MAIVPQPKCEPTNVSLIGTQWTIYSWPPEYAQPRVSKPGRSTEALLTKPIDFLMLRSEIDMRVEGVCKVGKQLGRQMDIGGLASEP